MARRDLLGLWMAALALLLLFADIVLVGIATTVVFAIYMATSETIETGSSVKWEPNLGDIISTMVDGLTSPWVAGILLVFAVQIWLLLRNANDVDLDASVSENQALTEQVQRLAQQIDITTPDVRLVDTDATNSFVVGRTGNATIYVTRGLQETLTTDQLTAVLAHELSHIKNRDVTVTTLATNSFFVGSSVMAFSGIGFLGGLATLLVMKILGGAGASLAGLLGSFPGANILQLVLGAISLLALAITSISLLLLVATIPLIFLIEPVAKRFGWAREYAADEGAVEIVGSPATLVSALQDIAGTSHPSMDLRETVRPFCLVAPQTQSGDEDAADAESYAVWPQTDTHPPVEDRIARIKDIGYRN